MALIEVVGLTKFYPVHRRMWGMLRHPANVSTNQVLLDVEFEMEAGEVVGIFGPNGAGKTTLLKIVAGLVNPSSGRISVAGWDVAKDSERVRSLATYCFADDRSFYWRLTGRQNLEFFSALNDLHGRDAGLRIEALAERLGIASYLEQPFFQYSAGIRQRFALTRALLPQPRVLMLDEPTRSIDPVEAQTFWSFVKDLVGEHGTAVLLVSHQPEEALHCDRIGILTEGRLRIEIDPARLGETTRGVFAAHFILDGFSEARVSGLRQLPGVRGVSYSERNGQQDVEFWSKDGDLSLGDLILALEADGARVVGFSRCAPMDRVVTDFIRGTDARSG